MNLICSSIILRHLNLNNICALYSEAVYYNLYELVAWLEAHTAVNTEALIDYRMLGVLLCDLLKRISNSVLMEESNKGGGTPCSYLI